MHNKSIIAFVHIEKAAGTTFTSILQHNFLYRHCEVKPLYLSDRGVFSARSMKTLFKINPFVESISGHSIKPYSDLSILLPNIKYVTILREPIARYVSQYQYHIDRMGSNWKFQDYLKKDFDYNFQTKKIAGSEDLEKAKEIIRDNFFLVGIAEEFDNFLQILKNKILPFNLDTSYQKKNVASKNKIKKYIYDNMDKYKDQIKERNKLDVELYEYAKNYIYDIEKKRYLDSENRSDDNLKWDSLHKRKIIFFLYKLYRKLYYEQIVKVIRYANGSHIGKYY